MEIKKLLFGKNASQKNSNQTNTPSSKIINLKKSKWNIFNRFSPEYQLDEEAVLGEIFLLPTTDSDITDNLSLGMWRLNEISEKLQACVNVEEVYRVFSDWMQKSFPTCSGHLFSVDVSLGIVKTVSVFGNRSYSEIEFYLDDCRALRQGREYYVDPCRPGLRCKHVLEEGSLSHTLCIPMGARGKNFSLFSMGIEKTKELSEFEFRLIDVVVKQLNFMIANLSEREILQQQSYIEPLTNLYNRRYLEDFLYKEIIRAERSQREIGLILLDIDHFKRFNDIYREHAFGDYILKEVGNLLQKMTRKSDIACRYGGEEMILILLESTLEDTRIRAENIREELARLPLHYGNKDLGKITASFGVACYPRHGSAIEELVAAADKAMYEAKRNGRDRVAVAE
jgi:diguanylate cyclase (GGDEF)-like protein